MNKLHRKGNDDAVRSIASHHRIGHLAFVNGVSGRGVGQPRPRAAAAPRMASRRRHMRSSAQCGSMAQNRAYALWMCILAETAVLPAMKSVFRRRPACLPIVHLLCIESIVGAIVVESTKGLEYYCSAPR